MQAVNVLGVVLPWGKRRLFRGEFSRNFDSIRAHTEWIDIEANVGLHIAAQQLTRQGHQDILSRISAMAASPSISNEESRSTALYRLIPHIPNPEFFGRKTELRRMHEVLIPERESRLVVLSIVGEAGVGKSQLALRFAYSNFNNFQAIFWISADTSIKIAQAYEEIAIEVGLVQRAGDQGGLNTIREITKKWLSITGIISPSSSCTLCLQGIRSELVVDL